MADQPDVSRSEARRGEALTDTIAAVATPAGRGGIGVVRVSGPRVPEIARQLLGHVPEPRHSERAAYRDANGEILDDGLAIYFPNPASYTGEHVLELHGHGSPIAMRLLLARCIALGARHAQPGEFTRRAFLNGKLDLAQAEAVADLIDASTERAARSALQSLKGAFSQRVMDFSAQLVELRMLVEATLDFPEEEIDVGDRDQARQRLRSVAERVSASLEQGRKGSVLRSGITVALIGQPNVGKSSLLNALAGDEVALVTDMPGTTRDAIRQTIEVEGVPIHIVDTAGLRRTSDKVEQLGIERTWQAAGRADAVLLVADAREGLQREDEAVLGRLPERVRRIVVFNKSDLVTLPVRKQDVLYTCAITGEGLYSLREALLQVAGLGNDGEDIFMARERHLGALDLAAKALSRAEDQLGMPELFAEELRLAQQHLNSITGEFSADDLLGEIFSRFCIGK